MIVSLFKRIIQNALIVFIPFFLAACAPRTVHEVDSKHECVLPDTSQSGALKNIPPGCYDYFVYSQQWMAERLAQSTQALTALQRSQQRLIWQQLHATDAAGRLMPAGLKAYLLPDPEIRFPVFCAQKPGDFQRLSFKLRQFVQQNYPIFMPEEVQTQWLQWGSCTGWSLSSYMSKVLELQLMLPTPELIASNVGEKVSYAALLDAYGGDAGQVFFGCRRVGDRQYFQSVSTLWTRRFWPLSQSALNPYASEQQCQSGMPIWIRKVGPFVDLQDHQAALDATETAPLTVAFGLDTTVLMSEQNFYQANRLYPQVGNAYWRALNRSFAMPRPATLALIQFHQARGDQVVFFTTRPAIAGDVLQRNLQQQLGLKQPVSLYFSEDQSQASWMKARGISLYYGADDLEMEHAIQAGVRPIRILDPSLSASSRMPGGFAETVVLAE